MDDIRDVKPPIDMPVDFWWLLILLIGAAVIAGLIYAVWHRRQIKPASAPIVVLCPSWETALERLEALRQKNYPQQRMYKPFYSNLSDIVRHYLEDRFNIRAPEMTTEEFLLFVRLSAQLKPDHKQSLKEFLNGCDLVKFAKHEPTPNEAMANFELAKKLIMETRDGI